jgi:hypothetical protein
VLLNAVFERPIYQNLPAHSSKRENPRPSSCKPWLRGARSGYPLHGEPQSDGLAVVIEEAALIRGHGGHHELRSFNASPSAGAPLSAPSAAGGLRRAIQKEGPARAWISGRARCLAKGDQISYRVPTRSGSIATRICRRPASSISPSSPSLIPRPGMSSARSLIATSSIVTAGVAAISRHTLSTREKRFSPAGSVSRLESRRTSVARVTQPVSLLTRYCNYAAGVFQMPRDLWKSAYFLWNHLLARISGALSVAFTAFASGHETKRRCSL